MIQKDRALRGRPRTFDEDEALERAIQVFWAKGYDGVTVDDLVAGMGVGRPSLYAIFGDKQALFLRCLRRYAERKGAHAADALLVPAAIRDGVRGLLRYSVESATEHGSAWGCLLICVAPLVQDPEVRAFVVRGAVATEKLVQKRLEAAIAAGELSKRFPAAARARLIVDVSRGLTVRAQMRTPRAVLLADASAAADLLVPREVES